MDYRSSFKGADIHNIDAILIDMDPSSDAHIKHRGEYEIKY